MRVYDKILPVKKKNAIGGQVASLQSQIDGKVETWYQSADPSTAWTTEALQMAHEGDLWYYTGATTSTRTQNATYRYSDSHTWQEVEASSRVFDEIDGKAAIYYGLPSATYADAEEGDYLVDATDGCTYRRSATNQWTKVTDYAEPVAAAAKVATNYMSYNSSYGLMVADLTGGAVDPGQVPSGVRNILISSSYVYIRNGQTKLARFGTSVYLGEDGSQVYIGSSSGGKAIVQADGVHVQQGDIERAFFGIENEAGVARIGAKDESNVTVRENAMIFHSKEGNDILSIAPTIYKESIPVYKEDPYSISDFVEGTSKTRKLTLETYPITTSSVRVTVNVTLSGSGLETSNKSFFTEIRVDGLDGWGWFEDSGLAKIIIYAEQHPETDLIYLQIEMSSIIPQYMRVEVISEGYKVARTVQTPSYNFGTGEASGSLASAFGKGTRATSDHQMVIGRYNEEDLDNAFAFIIGNGDGDSEKQRSNALSVTWDGYVQIADSLTAYGDIHARGVISSNEMKQSIRSLWIGASYMNQDQTANLSEAISEQLTGVVLIWSAFVDNAAQDYDWHHTFVSKWHVSRYPGCGVTDMMSNANFGFVGAKYVYVYDTYIKGNQANDDVATNSGIDYRNNHWVLRAVVGV